MTISRTLPIRIGFVLAAAGVLTLSACSASASSESAGSTAAATNAPAQQQMGGGGGVSGEIAAISGSTLQVQDTDSQTAVSYSDSTAITQSVAAALADVTSGVCVTSISGGFAGASGSSSSSTSTDTATAAASSVVISTAVDGECSTGFGGGAAGAMPGGAGGTPPTDAPDGGAAPTEAPDGVMPTGTPGDGDAPGGGGGGFASGLVTAVSGSTITVQTTDADGANSTGDITVDDSTTYTKTVPADSTALVVGACVTARGESDDSGAVTATTLAVSPASDSGCSTGFAGMGGGPGAGLRPGADSGTGTGSSTSGS